jgi:hypothetical protein
LILPRTGKQTNDPNGQEKKKTGSDVHGLLDSMEIA